VNFERSRHNRDRLFVNRSMLNIFYINHHQKSRANIL
jgi:hypothetical protein